MKKIALLMMLAAMLTNGWAQDLITPHQDNSVSGTENGHAWVDLGLPSGLKWATCNVGAANPWDYGDYFAWGETVGYGKSDPSNAHNKSYTGGSTVKTYNDWATYKYCSCSNYDCLTKYNYSSSYGSMVDNKKTLDLSDDAARVNMGGSWRMPTLAEQSELVDNCYWEWTNSYNGQDVKGYIVYKVKDASDKGKMNTATVGSYSLSDAHIFLPAAGCRSKSGLYDAGRGDYWSSSLRDSNGPNAAYYLDSYSGSVSWGNGSRYRGHSVRGVYDPIEYSYVDLGLPSGLKWATSNVGAANPWDYGNYFAWGETAPKSTYNWSTYLNGKITKSEDCGTDKDLLNGITDISGTQYDAAHTNMGGDWRMPTTEEQNELVENCYWEWTDSYNGKSVSGYIVYRAKDDSDKGKKKTKEGENSTTTTLASYSLADAHIFMPAAGYLRDSNLNDLGVRALYWSSSLNDENDSCADDLRFRPEVHEGCNKSFRFYGFPVRGVYDPIEYSYVDLGLPSGLKWATSNVGAANPWDYGNYFAWGETTPKSIVYNWSTYLDGKITSPEYCGTDKDLLNGITDISGTQYDAARTNMGGDWRMPTTEEQSELVENCYWEWTDSYNGKGVKGYIVYKVKDASDKGKKKYIGSSTTTTASYSPSDAHIFFPAAGYHYESDLRYAGQYGCYWSSSLWTSTPDRPDNADCLDFISDTEDWNYGGWRCYGRSVRGVYDYSETTAIEDTKESESINIVKYIDARGNMHIVLPDGRVYNIVGASVK